VVVCVSWVVEKLVGMVVCWGGYGVRPHSTTRLQMLSQIQEPDM
jgi:hypothetical protein